MLRSSKLSLSIRSRHRSPARISTVSHTCHIPRLSYSSCFVHPNIVWGLHKIQLNFCALSGRPSFPLDYIFFYVFWNIGGTVDLDKSKALQASNRCSAYLLCLLTLNFTANDQDLPTYINKSLFYSSVCVFYPSHEQVLRIE